MNTLHTPTKPLLTKWIGRSIQVVIVALILVMAVEVHAEASYRPAPTAIVRAAFGKLAPKAEGERRRAWVICRVWGRNRCTPALNVAWCESSLRPWARNGQYQGMFQMGSSERARFGHHPRSPWVQARAALRYYWLSGWSPWQCRP